MNQFLPTNLTFESTIHVGKYTTHGQQPSKTCSTPLVGSLKVRKMGHVLHISSSIGIAQAIIADLIHLPIESMYVIYTYIWLIFMVNVGKYTTWIVWVSFFVFLCNTLFFDEMRVTRPDVCIEHSWISRTL